MILSRSRRFIFIHIHKTGGESIVAALEPYLAATDLVFNQGFQLWLRRRTRKSYARFPTLQKHSRAIEIKESVSNETWNGFYKFAFVRHPVDRTISLYRFSARMAELRRRPSLYNALYLTPPGKRLDPLRWPAMTAFIETDSFSGFIRHPALVDDEGMQPQVNSICDRDGDLIIDFVARFERFDEDLARIQQAIGVPPHTAARTNVSGKNSVARPTPSVDDLTFLGKRFEVDFAHLDYAI